MGEVPLYLRIRDDLKKQILNGTLPAGSRLPSTRQLAADLKVSRITVTNAYAELEADGLIEARTGLGTFVAAPWPTAPPPDPQEAPEWRPRWQVGLETGIHPIRDAVLREAARESGLISFARARADPRLFPTQLLRRYLSDVLSDDEDSPLGYESGQGHEPLRVVLAQYLRQQGIAVDANDVIITAGAQQAIDLLGHALVQPGDRVIVESPTYPGALEVFEMRGAELIGVPLDDEGMSATALERVLRQRQPRLIYTVPTFHNPTGRVMSAARRREVVTLAQQYSVPVIEDEYLRQVRFGSPIPQPLAAFDQHGNVVHIGSFSKSLAPAFRLGYIVARGALRETLVSLKRAADVCTSGIMQRAVCRFLESGVVYSHWKRVSHIYRRRQAAMVAALTRHFPAGARWSPAQGGLLIWVELPAGVSVMRLLDEALSEGVSFAAGPAFFLEPTDQPFIRLNYAAIAEPEIERGIAILGRLVAAQCGQGSHVVHDLAMSAG
jgi:DNA-binding transcriptional MocR family regulator